MKELEERILKDGKILNGDVLMVGSFVNQQIDTKLLKNMAKEVKSIFTEEITKVLTIEASGIAYATAIAMEYEVPVVYAKKKKTSNVSGELLTAKVMSYTHNELSNVVLNKEYLTSEDKVLIADDFLATGNALKGLIELVNQAGAKLVGCTSVIEKEYQNGGNELRDKGIKVISLAKISKMENGKIEFDKN